MTINTRRGALRGTLFAAGVLFTAGALAAACGDSKSPSPTPDAGPGSGSHGFKDPAAAFATKTPIKHLVVIFGENISFDHYFGTYPKAANRPGEAPFTAAPNTPAVNNLLTPLDVNKNFAPITGVDLMANNPNKTNTANGTDATNPFRLSPAQASTADQDHNYADEQAAYDGGTMDLFPLHAGAAPFANETNVPGVGKGLVMGYYDGNTVAALWGYAQKFALNDNSWTTQFGPSTPGALNMIAGQTNGMVNPNADLNTYKATHSMPDGQGGFTMIGDIDPIGDVCSVTGGEVVQMTGKNVGDLLNAKNITWGAFMGGFDLTITNPDKSTGCKRLTPATPQPAQFSSVDYIPHHAWFQYYPSTANPTHARPSSVAAIGSSVETDGKTAEPANHNYDSHDFIDALDANNLPAVSFVKAPAWQDAHAGYSDPVDEQAFVVGVINALQKSPFWSTTAVIIAYDDSDGWYDHQAPPIVNPSSLAAIGAPTGAKAGTDSLNGPGVCNATTASQGKTTPATALDGISGKPVLGRCGYGTRLPLLVVSPFAKVNYVDHTLTDQSSVLRFIEDNWLSGQRVAPGASFDNIAGTLENMFSFPAGASQAELDAIAESRKLVLDPKTGHEAVR